jgi:hypothetical protein
MDNAWKEQRSIYIPVRLFTVSAMFPVFFVLSKTLREGAPVQVSHTSSVKPSHTLLTCVIQCTAVLLGFANFCL